MDASLTVADSGHFARASTSEMSIHLQVILRPWADGSNKPNLAKDHQGLVSEGKRRMARGITKHPMGLQDNSTNTNKRDAIQPDLRNRSSHPSLGRTHKPQEGVL